MNNKDRQVTLETRMYRNKTFGKENFCNKCWAKSKGCIATSPMRSKQLLCVKAECRVLNIQFNLREVICAPSRSWKTYGLTKLEKENE